MKIFSFLRWLLMILVIAALSHSYNVRDSAFNSSTNYDTTTTKRQLKEGASSSYLTPELDNLVRGWETSTISAQKAKEEIWKILKSQEFIEHRPNRGIVFVKTHKTGSSTVSSILHSLATSHNLTVPVTTQIEFDARKVQQRKAVLGRLTSNGIVGAPYDIWCNHVLFHETLLTEAVPTSEGRYFSIVRDPATRMRSACGFYKCCPAHTTEQYANYVLGEKAKERKQKKQWAHYCGLDQSFSEISDGKKDGAALKAIQDRMRTEELLLLVTERFIESMIVLRDFYNLHPLDVSFIAKKTNKRFSSEGIFNETSQEMIGRAYELMREWNPFDVSIHKLANAFLTRKMKDLYPQATTRDRVKEEVELLNDLLHHACAQSLINFTSQLNSWCSERELDNKEWNTLHLWQPLNLTHRPMEFGKVTRLEQEFLKKAHQGSDT